MTGPGLAGYVAQACRDEADAAARLTAAIDAGRVDAAIDALEDQMGARAFLRVVVRMLDEPRETMH